jgi:DNA-binding CsgD family transcriptional regulator
VTTPPSHPELPAPRDLVVETFEAGGHAFAILGWPAGRPPARPAMTPAEEAVLELLLAGFSNAEIALRRGRSARTVAHQVEAVFRRVGVGSRPELFALLSRAWSDPAPSRGPP